MRMLGVGGCGSGVGKTTLICRLIPLLWDWAVVKTSPHPLTGEREFELLEDPARLADPPESDTARYLAAGAPRVLWLRYRHPGLGPGLVQARQACTTSGGMIIEGTSFARHRRPEALILVARAGMDEIKPSAREVMARVDWLVLNRDGSAGEAEVARDARRFSEDHGVQRVVIADLVAERDPALSRLLGAIRVWSRR